MARNVKLRTPLLARSLSHTHVHTASVVVASVSVASLAALTLNATPSSACLLSGPPQGTAKIRRKTQLTASNTGKRALARSETKHRCGNPTKITLNLLLQVSNRWPLLFVMPRPLPCISTDFYGKEGFPPQPT